MTANINQAALDGLVVLDLTTGIAGGFAGKMLADLGARVVLVEPTTGSPFRVDPLFDYLSGGKESVVADSPATVQTWLQSADVVLTDGSTPWHTRAVQDRPQRTVTVDLSPFGRTGPYANWQSSDLVTWAMGGYLYFTGAPDREPIWVPGHQSQLHAGAHAVIAALVGLSERDTRSGIGQYVEVSELESVLTAHSWLVSSWAACGQVLGRQPEDLIRTADGWVYVMRIVPKDDLFVMIDRPDLTAENLTVDVPTWHANIPRIFAAVAEWAKDKTVAEIVELGQLLRIAVTPVLDGHGVLADEQLAARNWWEREGDAVFPGQPFHFSKTPSHRSGPAPALGEHKAPPTVTDPAPAEKLGAHTNTGAPEFAVSDPPLKGLRILEVTTNWAGPVAGRFLADLGADSIKVEWATRPATRSLFWAGPYQDLQRQPHHRAMYFNEMNRNKRGVCIDLSKPDGRAAFLELAKTVDVVLENNSARVMPSLGLSYDDLKAVNPSIIMVSMSGYGADGPHRDWVAYGANIETTSSLTSITGYPDGQLARTTLFYADPVSGNYACIAILAALRHRSRTGEGQWIDISLNEAGATYCAEALVDLHQTGHLHGPNANRDAKFAPQGVYRCIGTDNWVAITARSTEEWQRLATAINRPDLAVDPDLSTLVGRQRRHDELDEAITAWTLGFEQYETVHALQSLDIAAGPVLANWQIQADPHIHHRRMYETTVHPVVGAYPTTTWPWRFERTPAHLDRPAPLFAQHNREILQEAGLSDDAVSALYGSGTTADNPLTA
jgi:crotonobetainyl-CoA:carnitine CoA-transferase CaiB-like acyl-CoA transferase